MHIYDDFSTIKIYKLLQKKFKIYKLNKSCIVALERTNLKYLGEEQRLGYSQASNKKY
jgi:hypothetical protein